MQGCMLYRLVPIHLQGLLSAAGIQHGDPSTFKKYNINIAVKIPSFPSFLTPEILNIGIENAHNISALFDLE